MLFLFPPDTFSHPSFRICSNKEIQEIYLLTFSGLSFWSSSKSSVFMSVCYICIHLFTGSIIYLFPHLILEWTKVAYRKFSKVTEFNNGSERNKIEKI